MNKILSFLKPYRIAVGMAILLTFLELFVELLHPLLMAKIIDEGIMQKDLYTVIKWGGVMVAFSFISLAAGVINSFYSAHVSQSLGYDLRKVMYERVQSFSFSDFNRFPTSSLIIRLTNDVQQVQNTVFMALRIMLRAPLWVVGGLIMIIIVNVKLALILLATVPVIVLFLAWMMKRGGMLFRSLQDKLDGVNQAMRENLIGIRLIKAFLRSDYEEKRFALSNNKLKDETTSALRLMELTMPILLLLMNLGLLGVLWVGSFEVRAGESSVGEIVAIVNYTARITAAFSILSWIIMAFSRARASSDRLAEVITAQVETPRFNGAAVNIGSTSVKVEFQSVSFQYPQTPTPVLQQVSFVVPPGKTLAVLGATGSGKSSMFQLIPRLYEVNEGRILINDIPIEQMSEDSLRSAIGYVPQETLLFSGTIKDNISWGKSDATLNEIMEAADHAQISSFIQGLPEQYETMIGQKGVNLSGGQKQRLTIARALVRKPQILLLDDSTSALDRKTEAKLLQAIKNYQCTTFIITQKISTAKEADMILLLDEGRVLALGNHDQLLRESTLYRQIYQSQFGEVNTSYAP
jgi:ATP-binding cassette subfamily B multidrug efflux pump